MRPHVRHRVRQVHERTKPGRRSPVLATLIALLMAVPAASAQLPIEDDCQDVVVEIEPLNPTSADLIHVSVHGVQGGEVYVDWSLTDDAGNVMQAGSAFREANDDDAYYLDPLGPFVRDHDFATTVAVSFPDDSFCEEVAGPLVHILNAAPVGDFAHEPSSFHRGDPVAFTATDLVDADGDPITASWQLDGVPIFSGEAFSTTFEDLDSHTVALKLDDGIDTSLITRTVAAANRAPVVSSVAVQPTQVIRNQDFALTWEMSDGDQLLGYDALTPSAIIGPGDPDPVFPAGPSISANLDQPGTQPLVARASDGIEMATLSSTVTVLDRLAPDLNPIQAGAPHQTLHVPEDTGVLSTERDGPFLHHEWPAANATALAARFDWAATNGVSIITVASPSYSATPELHAAARDAHAAGALIVVAAPSAPDGAFGITGLSASPDVLTLAYGPNANDVMTTCGPAPELTPKPNLAVPATNEATALAAAHSMLVELVAAGVSDPLVLRTMLTAAASAADPFRTGAGMVHETPAEAPLLPVIPLTSYLDFGVVNDVRPQGTNLGVLNLNGLNVRLERLFGASPPQDLVTIRVDSEFHYFPDIMESGFAALACADEPLPTYHLTAPLVADVPPASINVTPLAPDVAALADAVNEMYEIIDPHLAANDFTTGLTLEEWDELDNAARRIENASAGLAAPDAEALPAEMDEIKRGALDACAVLEDQEACQKAHAIVAVADALAEHIESTIGAIHEVADTTTLEYRTDPARTKTAPRGLYLGYTTITTEGAGQAGTTPGSQPAPMRVLTALLLTGTTSVEVTYPGGSPVVGTTVEASAKPPIATPLSSPVDPVSNLFVTIPSGYHALTDSAGRVTLPYLAPIMVQDDATSSYLWHLGAYYDAPLVFDADSGAERMSMVTEPVSEQGLFGPSSTQLAMSIGRPLASGVSEFVLENLEARVAPDSFNEARALLARHVSENVELAVPTGVYSRVVDELMGDQWHTGTLDEGTLGTVDAALAEPLGGFNDAHEATQDAMASCPIFVETTCDLAPIFAPPSGGWLWTADGPTLRGVSVHGMSAGIGRYTFPLPDAEHIQLGLDVAVGPDTRGLAFMVVTMDEATTEELDGYLEEVFQYDATDPDPTRLQDTVHALHWFVLQHGHMARLLPLSESAASVAVGSEAGAGLLPGAPVDFGRGTTHSVATEFTLEGRETDHGSLTLIVLPALVGPASGSESGPGPGTVTQAGPLGGAISLDTTMRMLAFKPVEPTATGGFSFANAGRDTQAETWQTIVAVATGDGVLLDGVPAQSALRATPPATSGVALDFAPFETLWQEAQTMDDAGARTYAMTPARPVHVATANDESTCWYDPYFPSSVYEQVVDPRYDGWCVIVEGRLEVQVEPDEPPSAEGGAGLRVYRPHTLFYGEDHAALGQALGEPAGWLGATVPSYQTRWAPQDIAAAGANHDFVVLDAETLAASGPTVWVESEPLALDDAAYPVPVQPWYHEGGSSWPPLPW